MSVITISRQLGSGGSEIGRSVSEELGYSIADKTTLETIFEAYGFVKFDSIYDRKSGFWEKYDIVHQEIADFLQRVILAIAQKDNVVIIGRGSFAILRDFDNVLNVRVEAPFEARVDKVMDEFSIDKRQKAAREVQENDRVRKSFLSSYFHVDNENPHFFDLIFDTAKVTREIVTHCIADAARALDAKVSKEKALVTTGKIKVDEILSKEVDVVLEKSTA